MLSIESILKSGASNLGNLRDKLLLLRAALVTKKDQFPDLAESIDKQIAELDGQIAELDAPLSDEAVAHLALVVFPEVVNILHGKIEPKKHAGDSI